MIGSDLYNVHNSYRVYDRWCLTLLRWVSVPLVFYTRLSLEWSILFRSWLPLRALKSVFLVLADPNCLPTFLRLLVCNVRGCCVYVWLFALPLYLYQSLLGLYSLSFVRCYNVLWSLPMLQNKKYGDDSTGPPLAQGFKLIIWLGNSSCRCLFPGY